MFLATFTAIIIICFLENVASNFLLQTSSGPIQGVSTLSQDVEAFLGIPYAEPPIGDLRFAKPVPKKPWTETLHASELPSPCAQSSFGYQFYYTPNIVNMSEDCLYLNIWARKPISLDILKPVMIFLHPGGFLYGSSNMKVYDGANLARHGDVIVVTINYRLGPFGFYLAYTEEANGNMGMYDQVMAIKWVKDNAILFGGDKKNIVLMGESAGGISIAAHMVSPISKNLFHKAIVQSGGIILPFLFDNNTKLFKNSEAVASIAECSNDTVNLRTDPHLVVDCLKRKPMETIVEAEKRILYAQGLVFFPRTGDKFLPKLPIDFYRQGDFRKDVPVLTGINTDEGTMYLTTGLPDYFGIYGQNVSERINKHAITVFFRASLAIIQESNPSEVIDFYMRGVTNKTALGFTKMLANLMGDYSVACCTLFQADFFSRKGNPVFFYKFGFRSPSTPMAEWIGTTHLDEMQYIFGNPYHDNFTEEEVWLSNRLMSRWIAFAKTGNPNIPGQVSWLRYDHENPRYLSIEQEEEIMRINPLDRCKFWRNRFKAKID